MGVYQDDEGKTPILPSVAEAEKRIVSSATSKSYLAIDGTPEYNRAVQTLLLNEDHEIIGSERAVTVQKVQAERARCGSPGIFSRVIFPQRAYG